MCERLRFLARGRLQYGEALTKLRHSHERVPQKCCSYRGSFWIRTVSGALQRCQLRLHLGRPIPGPRSNLLQHLMQRGNITILRRHPAKFELRREVSRLCRQNLLNQF